jgi:hypothetical protein
LILLALFALFVGNSRAQIGTPPVFVVQPLGTAVQNGGTAILTSTAVSISSMSFNWLYNGRKITPDGTNFTIINVAVPLVGTVSTLTINHFDASKSGAYAAQVANGVGSVTSSPATVVVVASTVSSVVNILTSGTGMTIQGFVLHLSGPSGSNYVIQASTDLKTWTPIFTNTAPTGAITCTDAAALHMPLRYYRALLQ